MPLRPTSIADLDMRRRWNLADDDPGPTSLPKMLFPEDEARRLDEARPHMSEFRPERGGYGRLETFAEIGGQEGTDVLAGGAGDDTIVGTVPDTRRSNKHVSPVPDPHSSFIIPEGNYSPNANLGSLVMGSPSQSTAPFRYRSVAEQHGFDKAPNPAQVYTDGRRDYPSAQAAERDMPQFRNPPSAKDEYEVRRGKAFLDSIGVGALGLGPMSYVMGGSPEAVQASTQFDEALGGLAAGMAMRPGAQRLAPRAERQPVESFLQGYRLPALAGRLIDRRSDLPIGRGEVDARDIARASKEMDKEVALYRNRSNGQRYLRTLGQQMGDVPTKSRLILHTQPGEGDGYLSVQPSYADRAALDALGQKSSVIVNQGADRAIRYHRDSRNDGSIGIYENGFWNFDK